MPLQDALVTWGLLALIVGGAAWLYGWLILRQVRRLIAALRRSRDALDRSRRW